MEKQTKDFKYESQKLVEIIDGLEETLEGEYARLRALSGQYSHDARTLESLRNLTIRKISGIEKHIDKPYFARIDFLADDGMKHQCYIGKVGVIDLDKKTLVTDWRAPISTLYYDSNLGKVEYISSGDTIKGELKLKRQINIKEQELLDIFDVDSVSDDELLKPYLGASADNRLKNIVASIQKEQNDIIRMPLNKNLIVQGVAGSGKTTVALHRIAYLMYNYSKKYGSDQFMVIGPNKFFINYISNVLPDLDAGQAVQYTYEELAKAYIGEEFLVKDSTNKLVDILEKGVASEVSKYKLSMEYKRELDSFLEDFMEEYISKDGITVNGFCIFTKEEILEVLKKDFESFDVDFSKKLERVQKILEARVFNSNDLYISKAKEYFNLKIRETNIKEEKNNLSKLMLETLEKIEKGLKDVLKKTLTFKTRKILLVYKRFISKYKKYNLEPKFFEEISKQTAKNITKKELEFEDLPALMYIKLKLWGNDDFKNFIHVVVDEAQDFGTFNFFVLKKLMSSSTFSIFGDLTQGIYEYRAINAWEDVIDFAFDEKCELMKLEKSYRTTIEIMNAANLVSKSIGMFEGRPVIRHGEEVVVKKVSKKDRTNYILGNINTYTSLGHKSIAVICKTPEESRKVFEELAKYNENISLISGDKETYDGGICVVPAHLSKGLEFDCVLVYDSDEKVYVSNNKVDMKLLYVAMTRALHTLNIIYTDKVTKPIETLQKKGI